MPVQPQRSVQSQFDLGNLLSIIAAAGQERRGERLNATQQIGRGIASAGNSVQQGLSQQANLREAAARRHQRGTQRELDRFARATDVARADERQRRGFDFQREEGVKTRSASIFSDLNKMRADLVARGAPPNQLGALDERISAFARQAGIDIPDIPDPNARLDLTGKAPETTTLPDGRTITAPKGRSFDEIGGNIRSAMGLPEPSPAPDVTPSAGKAKKGGAGFVGGIVKRRQYSDAIVAGAVRSLSTNSAVVDPSVQPTTIPEFLGRMVRRNVQAGMSDQEAVDAAYRQALQSAVVKEMLDKKKVRNPTSLVRKAEGVVDTTTGEMHLLAGLRGTFDELEKREGGRFVPKSEGKGSSVGTGFNLFFGDITGDNPTRSEPIFFEPDNEGKLKGLNPMTSQQALLGLAARVRAAVGQPAALSAPIR